MRLTVEQIEQRERRKVITAQYKKLYDELEHELKVDVVITFEPISNGVRLTAKSEKHNITFTKAIGANEQFDLNFLSSLHSTIINYIISENQPLKDIMNKQDNAISINKATEHRDPRQDPMYGSRR